MQQSPTAAETKPTARHTPGPWAAQLRNGVGRNRNASTINGMQIRSSNGLHVASVTVVADKPIDQKEADAHLIAAAPDLYAALENLIFHSQAVGSGELTDLQRGLISKSVERAQAALFLAAGNRSPFAKAEQR